MEEKNKHWWLLDTAVGELTLPDFKEFILQKWLAVCIQSGLVSADDIEKQDDFLDHSIDIKFNCSTSDYLAKYDCKSHWGIDREIAKASSKKGKKNGKHPFQLIEENQDELFLEFAKAIKGKAQLYWSRGLKEKVGIFDITDEEAAEKEADDKVIFVGLISKFTWSQVIRKELRSKVLDLAEDNKDIDYIRSFILSPDKMNDPMPSG